MIRLRLRNFWLKRGADITAISALAIFFMILFRRQIFGGALMLGADPITYSYPMRMAAWEMIRNGELPLWTPLILSGYPLLSMAQLALGYPLTWGYLFLPGQWAEHIIIIAPYLLAPIFTYAYAREVGRSRLASALAGLSFGYGGLMFSSIGINGMLTNAVMWLPLFLIAIERARTRRFIPCLLLAAASYTMSVLTGIGQGFVYAGTLALAYAVFVVLYPKRSDEQSKAETEEPDDWRNWRPLIVISGLAVVARTKEWADRRRWRPLAVAVGGIALASGLAAFQILEALRAAKQSVRGKLSYEQFTEGSLNFGGAFRGWLQPIYPLIDVTLYVAPLTTVLAIAAVWISLRQSRRNPLIIFWAVVAVTAFILILGKHTPIYHIVHQLPFINRFRIPPRHSFEWTFALSILGAYGWDAIAALIDKWRETASARRERYEVALGIVCLAASVAVGVFWWRFSSDRANDVNASVERVFYPYLGWKVAFTLLICVSVWLLCRMKNNWLRVGLSASVIALACFIEPFIQHTRWHYWITVPAGRFDAFAPTTDFLRRYPPEQNRVYSSINPFTQFLLEKPTLDAVNFTAIAGLQHVAGYEPLIQERYSRALNNLPWEKVHRGPWLESAPALFEAKSHVLDLLNTTFAIVYADKTTAMTQKDPGVRSEATDIAYGLERKFEKDGVTFSSANLEVDPGPDSPTSLACDDKEGDTLALVTSLENATNISDREIVATLSIYTGDGRVIERQLRAGVDTAEWAYERADVKRVVKHAIAPVFDSFPGDSGNSWQSHRFLSRIALGERARIERVEITKARITAGLRLWKASLYDSSSSSSTPLSVTSGHWQTVYEKDGVKIIHNTRALPRAWLVTDARCVGNQDAWATIRGQGDRPFDPRRTALLELAPDKMPALSGRPLSEDSYARIVSYEPNRLVIETKTDQPAVLVVSEMHYPGWVATIDGEKTSIHTTNFLLRGIVAPAGLHRVEMQYVAPGARNGAIVSLFTLLLIGALAVYAKWKPTIRSPSNQSSASQSEGNLQMNAERMQKLHYDRIGVEYEAHYGDPCSQRYRDKFFHQPMFEGMNLSGMKVIEAMCGSGQTTQYLISQGAQVTGLDISDNTIMSFNKRWPETQAVCASILDSGLNSDSYDAVVIVGGLHHLHPNVDAAIDEIHRVLKSGGYLCFAEPHKGSFPDLVRRWWYKRDSLFSDNEEAIDLSEMKSKFASRFIFNQERYLGNAAYLLVLNSMVLRIPLKLKPFYTLPLLILESLISQFQGRLLSCFVVCQWRKK
jgi:SAM-dependent methyltransferase